MADKKLDIEAFYMDDGKEKSAIFENYYMLETVLTSPYAQAAEFDTNGNPVFTEETRGERDIRCVERMQQGIEEYFDDYIRLVPKEARTIHKRQDEMLLALINRIQIEDEDFLRLMVEDPFFGRVTEMRDIVAS